MAERKKSYRGLKPGQTGTRTMTRGPFKGRKMKMRVGPSGKPYPVKKPR